jgi:hypothetical protein
MPERISIPVIPAPPYKVFGGKNIEVVAKLRYLVFPPILVFNACQYIGLSWNFEKRQFPSRGMDRVRGKSRPGTVTVRGGEVDFRDLSS